MMRTDDPNRDYMTYLDELEQEDAHWPHCDKCGETVTDYVWVIDGEFYCDECARQLYRKDAERYYK